MRSELVSPSRGALGARKQARGSVSGLEASAPSRRRLGLRLYDRHISKILAGVRGGAITASHQDATVAALYNPFTLAYASKLFIFFCLIWKHIHWSEKHFLF